MRRSRIELLLAVALFTVVQLGATQTAKAQVSPFAFLELNQSARAAALGGAFVAMSGDPNAVFFNPATLAAPAEQNASATFLNHALDISSGLATYSFRDTRFGDIAASVLYTSYGSFERRDRNANQTGTFSAQNLAALGTWAREIDTNLYLGVTGKFFFATLADQSVTGLAGDVGMLYHLPNQRVNIGVSILNLGTAFSEFGTGDEPLPVDVRVGFNHRLRGLPLLFNFSFHHLADDRFGLLRRLENIAIGGELTLSKLLDVRVGFDNRLRAAVSSPSQRGLAGFSGGIGVKAKKILVDYGAVSWGEAAMLHRISLNVQL